MFRLRANNSLLFNSVAVESKTKQAVYCGGDERTETKIIYTNLIYSTEFYIVFIFFVIC